MAVFTSILFPHRNATAGSGTAPDCFRDLHLDDVVAAVTRMYADEHLEEFFYAPLGQVSAVEYRHQVFCDLDRGEMRQPIENFVDAMRKVRRRLDQAGKMWHLLQRQGWLVNAAHSYCDAVGVLHGALSVMAPISVGLQDLTDHLARYVNGDAFQRLAADTAAVQAELGKVAYTVHIQGLRVHVDKYTNQADYSPSMARTFERFATEARKDYHVPFKNFDDMNHVEEKILECVARLYPDTFALLDAYCQHNQHFIEPILGRFEHEIRFYLAYSAFVERLNTAGLPFTYPDVTADFGVFDVEHAFDLALAIKAVADSNPIVRNDFSLSSPERIFIVTGPNQGGKTTLARSVGQCAYLAALGCPIPAKRASLTLPDRIYTHFERRETLSTLHGKLDDELVRIRQVLSRASAASVIVMNESFSSTTVNDALLIGTEILERIIELSCVAVYVSFLDELADLSPACVSMVGEVARDNPTQRTFAFTRRPADGRAYAAALALKYGLSYAALRQRIHR